MVPRTWEASKKEEKKGDSRSEKRLKSRQNLEGLSNSVVFNVTCEATL